MFFAILWRPTLKLAGGVSEEDTGLACHRTPQSSLCGTSALEKPISSVTIAPSTAPHNRRMSCLSLGLGLIDWGDPCYQDLTQRMDSGDPIYSALANILLDWTAQPSPDQPDHSSIPYRDRTEVITTTNRTTSRLFIRHPLGYLL
jgi:hypothetical protein